MFKLILRVLVAIVIGIPTLPIAYVCYSIFGIVIAIALVSMIQIPYGWLINDKSITEEGVDAAELLLEVICAPILFWINFIKGENHIKTNEDG